MKYQWIERSPGSITSRIGEQSIPEGFRGQYLAFGSDISSPAERSIHLSSAHYFNRLVEVARGEFAAGYSTNPCERAAVTSN